ncbi:hypothetical protein PO124_11610 [Bacillus licheniformis]|nr:hypothetical protein [Bacillus licheniformis]
MRLKGGGCPDGASAASRYVSFRYDPGGTEKAVELYSIPVGPPKAPVKELTGPALWRSKNGCFLSIK